MMKLIRPTALMALTALIAILSAWAAPAFAHDGHGAPNPHLHGPDWLGLAALAVAGGAVLWFLRRK